jgi:hypothetical protein
MLSAPGSCGGAPDPSRRADDFSPAFAVFEPCTVVRKAHNESCTPAPFTVCTVSVPDGPRGGHEAKRRRGRRGFCSVGAGRRGTLACAPRAPRRGVTLRSSRFALRCSGPASGQPRWPVCAGALAQGSSRFEWGMPPIPHAPRSGRSAASRHRFLQSIHGGGGQGPPGTQSHVAHRRSGWRLARTGGVP